MDILIKNGRIWDGTQFFQGDILTEDGVIAEIGSAIDAKASFTYDAAGKTVSAGLVDAHTHLKGISTDKYGTPTDSSCFPFGVTATADAGAELGDRAILGSFAVKNAVFVCTKIKNNCADLTEVPGLLKKYGDKAVGLKVYFSGINVQDTAPLQEICDYAHERSLSVMVHCNGSPMPMASILAVLQKGDILTHAFHGGPNSAMDDDFESLRAAQKRGIVIDAGFAGQVHTDFQVLQKAIAAKALPDIISTDITKSSAFTRGGRYGLTMCMSMARTAGMEEAAIFRAVTTAPAKALGRDWGRLEIGRAADIAVLDYADEGFSLTDKAGNTLKSSTGYRCLLTVADGQVVYKY